MTLSAGGRPIPNRARLRASVATLNFDFFFFDGMIHRHAKTYHISSRYSLGHAFCPPANGSDGTHPRNAVRNRC